MEQWEYIKGLGWIDVQPQRGVQMRCRGCGRTWASEMTFTDATIPGIKERERWNKNDWNSTSIWWDSGTAE